MSAPVAWAVFAGLALGGGLWLAFVRLPAMRQTSFADRVAPQLRSGRTDSRLLAGSQVGRESPFGPLGRIFAPILLDAVAWLNRINPLGESLDQRLKKAGLSIGAADFRAQQLVWAGLGFLASTAYLVFSAVAGRFNPALAVVLVVGATAGGFLLREWYLGEQIQRRGRRILGQFPGTAELMALAVGAGESTIGAIERIGRTSKGDLADEFTATLADVRAGVPLAEALRRLEGRVELPAMTRFVDAINVASERGTPIAGVLRAQAQDVRDAAKRELMETAGKKEIGMLAPVVFGILPLTIVFAVYPGLSLLDLNL
ncbi:type II secretion system F family protein [Zafaria sp. Z1313]|uniref:type II secretion system F family protein n=1 Tax=Zafaria sp. Z1313 TaxID=3423202 RepID=UPI003D30327F